MGFVAISAFKGSNVSKKNTDGETFQRQKAVKNSLGGRNRAGSSAAEEVRK